MEQLDPRLMALAVPAAYFVGIGVDLMKGVLGDDPRTRWALPLCGVLLAWIVVAAVQVYQNVPLTPQMWAGSILAGLLAYQLAAGANAVHKAVRRPRMKSEN